MYISYYASYNLKKETYIASHWYNYDVIVAYIVKVRPRRAMAPLESSDHNWGIRE